MISKLKVICTCFNYIYIYSHTYRIANNYIGICMFKLNVIHVTIKHQHFTN